MKLISAKYQICYIFILGSVGCGGNTSITPDPSRTITGYSVMPGSLVPSAPTSFSEFALLDQRIVDGHSYRVGGLKGIRYSWVDSVQTEQTSPFPIGGNTIGGPSFIGPTGIWWTSQVEGSSKLGAAFQPYSGSPTFDPDVFGRQVSHRADYLIGSSDGGAVILDRSMHRTILAGPAGHSVSPWSVNSSFQATSSNSAVDFGGPFYLLTTAGPSDLPGIATCITDNGTIAGADGQIPTYWKDGVAVHLPLPDGFESGFVISASPNAKFLIGITYAGHFSSKSKSVVWQVTGHKPRLLDVGGLANFEGSFTAKDISDEGQVIGFLVGPDDQAQSAILVPVLSS